MYYHLDQLKQRLDAHRPLSPAVINNLREDLVLRWTYHSNAIEGNTLTLKETKVALEGITVGGKTMQEHLEAINHREAIFFVEELVNQKEPLSQRDIKDIHQLILKKIDDQNAGIYRNTNVIIAGAEHAPPDFVHVLSEMEDLMRWYQNEAQELHPVERAGRVHADFVKIHPFADGNGKTSRLLMNLELMKAGFPAAVLPVEKRLEYYEALNAVHTQNDYQPFLYLIMEIVELSFEPYWHVLSVKQ